MKYIFKILKYIICSVILLSLINCNKGGGASAFQPSKGGVTLDSKDGGISNEATNVSLKPLIILKFTASVIPGLINHSDILISTSMNGDNPVAIGSFTLNTLNTKVHFSPLAALKKDTLYYIIVKNIQSANGDLMDGRFSFTTGSTSYPTVSIVNPDNEKSGVWNTTTITVNFSQHLNNVNSSNIKLHMVSATGSEVVLSSITEAATGGNVYTIQTSHPLNYLTTYYLTVGGDIVNNSGNALIPAIFNFTTVRQPILYITNFGAKGERGDTVSKCQINLDKTLNCSDSGAGIIFNLPFDIAIDGTGNTAYISNSGESLPYSLGNVEKCGINNDGSFHNCNDSGAGNGFSSPFGIAINPAINAAYVANFNINGVTTCEMESSTFKYCNLKKYVPNFESPAAIEISNINNNTYAYIANFSGDNILKCGANSQDLFLQNCVDSGVGGIIPSPYGITVMKNDSFAYVTSHFGDMVYGCKINTTTGNFTNCNVVVTWQTINKLQGNQPSLITFNKYNNELYFTGSKYNQLIECNIINDNNYNLNCQNVTINGGESFHWPSGVRIRY